VRLPCDSRDLLLGVNGLGRQLPERISLLRI
jgi:hypothetical protein